MRVTTLYFRTDPIFHIKEVEGGVGAELGGKIHEAVVVVPPPPFDRQAL